MNHKKIILLFIIMISILGCMLPQNLSNVSSPIETSIPTATITKQTPLPTEIIAPTPSPTKQAVATPEEPENSVEWAVPQPIDIPASQNLRQIPASVLGINSDDLSGVKFKTAETFLYAEDVLHVLTGFVVNLDDADENEKFEQILSQPDEAINNFIEWYELDVIAPWPEATGLTKEQIYKSYKVNFLKRRNINVILEVIIFKQNNIGVYLLNTYSEYLPGGQIAVPVANNLDQRLQQGLASENEQGSNSSQLKAGTSPELLWMLPPPEAFPEIFRQVILDDTEVLDDEWQSNGYIYDNLFVFANPDTPETLIGFNIVLYSAEEIGYFDYLMSDTDSALEETAKLFGATNFRDYDHLYELDGIGDVQRGRNVIGEIDGNEYLFSIFLFRNHDVGTYLFTINYPTPHQRYELTYDPNWLNIRTVGSYISSIINAVHPFQSPYIPPKYR